VKLIGFEFNRNLIKKFIETSRFDEIWSKCSCCTWMTKQLMKGVWNANFRDFLDLLQEVESNPFEFWLLSI
jgi:hypothetical protein